MRIIDRFISLFGLKIDEKINDNYLSTKKIIFPSWIALNYF